MSFPYSARLSGVLAAAALLAAPAAVVAADWKPEKEVTLVVPYGAGGGTDNVARALAQVINDNKLSDVQWVVVNRAGGGGLTAHKYMTERPGDAHTLMFMTSTGMSQTLLQDVGLKWSQLTPVSNAILDVQYLATSTASGFKTAEDLVKFARDNPGKLRVGGASIGSEDHFCNLMLDEAAAIKTTYIPFGGGGEIKSQLLGGHLQAAWLNPSEMEGLLVTQGGTIFPLAVAWPERIYYDEVPTFKEVGYDVVFDAFFRGVLGTPQMPKAAVAYYEGVIAAAARHPDWQARLDKGKMNNAHMTAAQFQAGLEGWDKKLSRLVPLVKAAK